MSEFDCQTCGACCIEAGAVTVTPDDAVPKRWTQSVRGRMGYASDEHLFGTRMMRQECPGTRCVALRGTVGAKVGCAIYARRPEVCRSFAPGSEGCLAARETMVNKRRRPEWAPHGYEARPTPIKAAHGAQA